MFKVIEEQSNSYAAMSLAAKCFSQRVEEELNNGWKILNIESHIIQSGKYSHKENSPSIIYIAYLVFEE